MSKVLFIFELTDYTRFPWAVLRFFDIVTINKKPANSAFAGFWLLLIDDRAESEGTEPSNKPVWRSIFYNSHNLSTHELLTDLSLIANRTVKITNSALFGIKYWRVIKLCNAQTNIPFYYSTNLRIVSNTSNSNSNSTPCATFTLKKRPLKTLRLLAVDDYLLASRLKTALIQKPALFAAVVRPIISFVRETLLRWATGLALEYPSRCSVELNA